MKGAKDALSLIGLPLAGKSVLAKHIAQAQNWTHYDLDSQIEALIGMPIHLWLRPNTEKAFRQTELKALKTCLKRPKPFVLSVGGGTPLLPNAMTLLCEASTCIFLDLPWRELHKRLTQTSLNTRPLLKALATQREPIPTHDTLKKHLIHRLEWYQKAHFRLKVENKSIQQLTKDALSLLNQEKI